MYELHSQAPLLPSSTAVNNGSEGRSGLIEPQDIVLSMPNQIPTAEKAGSCGDRCDRPLVGDSL